MTTKPKPKPHTTSPLTPGPLNIEDPENVVAYLRESARIQRIDNPGQYHPGDHFYAMQRRAGDDAPRFVAAIHAGCTTILRDTTDSKETDLAYHLTTFQPPRAFLEVLIDRLERDDLPAPGPPLYKDLRHEFLTHASTPAVMGDAELRRRFRDVAMHDLRWDVIVNMALVADPDGDLVPALRGLSPEALKPWFVEHLARVVHKRDPDALLEVAGGLARAPRESLEAYAAEVAKLDPAWFGAHGEQLEETLYYMSDDPADWR